MRTSHFFIISWERVSCLSFRLSLCLLPSRSLGFLESFSNSPLSVFYPPLTQSSLPPGHHENHLIWVDSSLMAHLERGLVFLSAIDHRSCGPASLPDCCEPSDLRASIQTVLLGLHADFSFELSLGWYTLVEYCAFIVYCLHFALQSVFQWLILQLLEYFCSTVWQLIIADIISIVQFNYFLLDYSSFTVSLLSLFWSWKCIPGIWSLTEVTNTCNLDSINIILGPRRARKYLIYKYLKRKNLFIVSMMKVFVKRFSNGLFIRSLDFLNCTFIVFSKTGGERYLPFKLPITPLTHDSTVLLTPLSHDSDKLGIWLLQYLISLEPDKFSFW